MLSEKEFYELNKKEQTELLKSLDITLTKGLKEIELYKLYKGYFEIKESEIKFKPIEIPKIAETKTEFYLCPNCNNPLIHIKDSDYKCDKCGHKYSGFPPEGRKV